MMFQIRRSKDIFGNLVFAIMINLQLINYTLVTIKETTTGFLTIIYPCFFVIVIIIWMSNEKLRIDFRGIIFFGILFVWYLINASISRISMVKLCAYTGIPLFTVPNFRYRTEYVLIYTMIISVIFVLGFQILLERKRLEIVDMDIAYSVLPSIIAGIIHFSYYLNKHKKICWIIYLIPLYYFFQLLMNGLRGPLFCIIITVILLAIIQFDKDNQLKFNKMICRFFIAIIIMFIFFVFLDIFLQVIVNIFQILNIDAYFISKTIRLLNDNDIMNGRNILWKIAWDGFKASPIWGNGFDSFQYNTGYVYVHNFILQSLYDGGLIFFITLLTVFIYGIHRVIQSRQKDNIVMLIFLFGLAFTYSSLSQDMFNVIYLWILISFLLMQKKKTI